MISELYITGVSMKSSDTDYTVYPFSLPVVRNMDQLRFEERVTFLVGENGTGKSTLLEAIAVSLGFNAEGGSKSFSFSTRASHSQLHEHISLSRGVKAPRDGYFLRAESLYNLASEIDELALQSTGAYGGVSLHEQSHGEGFMSLVLNRFFGNGLYLLDEPEAALSPTRLMALISRISELVGMNSQFIIATHSPILLSYPGAQIYVLTDEAITLTPYRETEHYIITKQFLNDPEGMLRLLID